MEADATGGREAVGQGGDDLLREGAEVADRLRRNVERVVIGKRGQVELVLTALACRGHVLLEDVPGTAKTVLARALSGSIDRAVASRIQCTPDLQPTDVTGLLAFDPRSREFEFRPGPVFANVLLVDEINRAMPKTQSALLEAMAESQVTVDGVTRPLPDPFLLIATENPIEQEGTFPLPEAQLDRFFLRTSLGYPREDEELRIVQDQHAGHPLSQLAAVASAEEVSRLQRAVEEVYVDELLQRWIVALVRATRELDFVAVGASVRGSLALERAVRAYALVQGREYAEADDVERLFGAVILHRLLLEPASLSEEEVDAAEIGRRVWRRCLERRPAARATLGRAAAARGAGPAVSPQRAFPLIPRRRLLGLPFGDRRSLRRGTGSEVVGSRAYRRGDPIASIDWPASARLSALRGQDEFIVRQYVAEEAPSVVLVIDRRPSMALYDGTLPFLHKPVRGAAGGRGDRRVGGRRPRADRPGRGLERPAAAAGPVPHRAPAGAAARRRGAVRGARATAWPTPWPCSPGAAPSCPPGRSCSWSPTSWPRSRRPPGGACAASAGTSSRSSCRTRRSSRASPCCRASSCRTSTPTGGRVLQVRLRRREAEARRREHEERHAALLERMLRAGADPVLLSSEEPFHVDQAFAAWADRRRLQVRRLR